MILNLVPRTFASPSLYGRTGTAVPVLVPKHRLINYKVRVQLYYSIVYMYLTVQLYRYQLTFSEHTGAVVIQCCNLGSYSFT
eukprot:SAG31_NODE_4839_length_2912_cov_2.358692_2_plen_82_part_00